MNERDFDRIARAFMADGPTQLADRVLDSSLADVHHRRQRRVLVRAPWRTPVMNIYAKVAAAAVVIVAVGALGFALLRPSASSPSVGGPAPSTAPSPSPSPTPEPSKSPYAVPNESSAVPPLTGTFTSTRHGISLAIPEGWTTQPATETWDGRPFPNYGDPDVDVIHDPLHQGELWLMVASVPLGATEADAWPNAQFAAAGCPITVPITVDGALGYIGADLSSTDCSVAFVNTTDRGYQIRLYDSTGLPGYDRAWFDQVLATVDLRPEDAVD